MSKAPRRQSPSQPPAVPASLANATPEPARTEGELLAFVEDLKRQWMSTIDALVDPLMIVGRDYVVRKANLATARMGGADVRATVGRHCYEAFAGRSSPCVNCTLQEPTHATTNSTFELEDVRGDRFFEVSAQPLVDAQGRPDGGVVHVYRDRTEAKKMQRQLAQQDKLASIGLLAGGVAHEINNPLGGILIFSQMLLREMAKESPHYSDVVEIEAATQRCKAIVESLLDFARQNPEGSRRVKLVEINALDAVRTAIRFSRAAIKNAGSIDLREDFDDDQHLLICDRNRIIQVFLNLVQNAIQAMPDGGTVSVRATSRLTPTGQLIGVYEVEDTGVGISQEDLPRIFDPFFTTKDPGEGTGLGLALCYGIIQDLNGTMTVSSTLHVGTRFTIELPLTATKPTAKAAS